jgi:hypothetical protein
LCTSILRATHSTHTAGGELDLLPALVLDGVGPRTISAAVLTGARRVAPVLPLITPGLHVVGEKFVRRLASR